MNSNDDRRQNYHQAEQGMGSLACLSSGENAIAFEGPNYDIAASEVMDLVSEMTRTSAEIYELIADLAGSFVEQPQESRSASNPPFRSHLDVLLDIISATQRSEIRVKILEFKIVSTQPSFLDSLLLDCRLVLEVFKEAGKNLTSVIGWDESTSPQVTVAETLILTMKQVSTCFEQIAALPETGMTVSYQCLLQQALDLQRHVGKLINEAAGPS